MVLDEVQRVPDHLLAIKHQVDVDPHPSRFLITGSARLLAPRDLPDTLPGRSETIELWPLSQGEIDRAAENFVDAVFTHSTDLTVAPATAPLTMAESPLHREDYLERASRDGYPARILIYQRGG